MATGGRAVSSRKAPVSAFLCTFASPGFSPGCGLFQAGSNPPGKQNRTGTGEGGRGGTGGKNGRERVVSGGNLSEKEPVPAADGCPAPGSSGEEEPPGDGDTGTEEKLEFIEESTGAKRKYAASCAGSQWGPDGAVPGSPEGNRSSVCAFCRKTGREPAGGRGKNGFRSGRQNREDCPGGRGPGLQRPCGVSDCRSQTVPEAGFRAPRPEDRARHCFFRGSGVQSGGRNSRQRQATGDNIICLFSRIISTNIPHT